MEFHSFSRLANTEIDAAMYDVLSSSATPLTTELQEMMIYHLGFEDFPAPSQVRGKRVRPLLVLLCTGAVDPDEEGWKHGLPSAAAVELLHNFSLIHDDIQDNSAVRRGRPTVWRKWGIPQAINAGDAMYTLAYRALLRQTEISGAQIALAAQAVFQETCIALTRGQYLDLAFETRAEVTTEAYWAMIGGKTAALVSACAELGALAGGAGKERRMAFAEFGLNLGLAFQVQDDVLGIWGEEQLTGKSAASDLVAGKKSLPVLYGLSLDGPFAARWREGPVRMDEAQDIAELLRSEGALEYAQEQAASKTELAMQALSAAAPSGATGTLLAGLARDLLGREQ